VALAWGKHLFPFRTEQLSPTAPMVLGLHGPGRVGRRRLLSPSRLRAARVVKPWPGWSTSACSWAASASRFPSTPTYCASEAVRGPGTSAPALATMTSARNAIRAIWTPRASGSGRLARSRAGDCGSGGDVTRRVSRSMNGGSGPRSSRPARAGGRGCRGSNPGRARRDRGTAPSDRRYRGRGRKGVSAAVVQRVLPSPVLGRRPRERVPAHGLVGLGRVDDRLPEHPAGVEVVRARYAGNVDRSPVGARGPPSLFGGVGPLGERQRRH
jgi:hypothetical protein